MEDILGPAKTERWKHKRMKRFYKKAVSLLMAAVLCTGIFSGCEALDTTLPDDEETQEAIETRKAQANPQKALEQIYSCLLYTSERSLPQSTGWKLPSGY